MSEHEAEGVADGLLDRVELIESQPLEERAARYQQVHDELLAELERSDREGGHTERG